jgi:hypothetical protein
MKLFTTEIKVKAYHFKGMEYECPYRIQYLVKIFKFIGIPFFYLTLDSEFVPNHVWIGIGALGFDSSNWKSKFKEYIK